MKNFGKNLLSLFLLTPLVSSCSGSTSIDNNDSKTTPSACSHQLEEFHVEPTISSKGYSYKKCSLCGYETEHIEETGLAKDDSNLSILFIGNSYTFFTDYDYDKPNRDISKTTFMKFKQVAKAAGINVTVDGVTTGGYYLYQHADPSDSDGAIVNEKLSHKGAYDFVFMQEQSMAPVLQPAIFYDGVRNVNELVEQSGAKGVLYETWGRNSRSPDLNRYGLTNETHTQKTIAAYQAIADELNLPIAHVGTAFYNVYRDFDGIINLYNNDFYHPSEYGTYLIALVFYATVFGRSPIGLNAFGVEYEDILEEAAHEAVFGPSILKDEYKTSSIGITTKATDADSNIERDPAIPEQFITTEVNPGLGNFDISCDENGIFSFTNTSDKSSLMFKEKLFSGSGTISFDLKVNGGFTGGSNQGIIFGNSSNNVVWNTSSDSFYSVGRSKDGKTHLLTIHNGALDNQTSINSLTVNPMSDVEQTYRIKLVVDRSNWLIKTYVNESYAGSLFLKDHYDGEYLGLMSGINGRMTISNIQINQKGIKIINYKKNYTVTRGSFTATYDENNHPVFTSNPSKDNATFILNGVHAKEGTIVEFDMQSSDYTGSTGQGIMFGLPSETYDPFQEGSCALIGRLKTGKIGGIVIDNSAENEKSQSLAWKYGSDIGAGGDALQVMQDDSKTYHLKAIYHYISSKEISIELYVDGVFGRHLKYVSTLNDFGDYIAFNAGLNGSVVISNIKVDNEYFKDIL